MISIVLPAYNEEKNIGPAIDEISDFLNEINKSFEIIAVDDGSKDNTAEILEKYREKYHITVITHPKNLGYGTALRSGFAKAGGDLIFFTDSDRQFDIRDLKVFLEKIENYDFIIGYRKSRKDSFWRIFYASIFRFLSHLLFDVNVKDGDCAFKLFKKHVLKSLSLVSMGALINLEILAKAKKKNYKFIELPVKHFPRQYGKQTGGSPKVLFKALFNIFLLWMKIR